MADFLQRMAPYLSIINIILGVVVTALVLAQVKGSDLGGFLGGSEGTYRTRRGVEATMYRATIGFFIAFFIVTMLTFMALGQS
ncbi:MAG: preprotein translocase subunit SecG [Ardenticatenaceae bacterium]|nr:preprotein translocase subunit SecG [Anaerolineales bacterium]MCB8916964.1 preprotein translocase subunit SecG [Ardenticatenaceae bacterium]